jgi:hypothetical protein
MVFGFSQDLTTSRSLHPEFSQILDLFIEGIKFLQHFPYIAPLALQLPDKLAMKLAPGYIVFRKVTPIPNT